MKKLLTLIALVGMGAFMAGCAEEKPAAPAGAGSTPTMHGPGAVGSPPMHNPASGDKMSDEKADKGDEKDTDADKDEKKE